MSQLIPNGAGGITSIEDFDSMLDGTGFHAGPERGNCEWCNDPGIEVLEIGSVLDNPETQSGNAVFCASCAREAWEEYLKWGCTLGPEV